MHPQPPTGATPAGADTKSHDAQDDSGPLEAHTYALPASDLDDDFAYDDLAEAFLTQDRGAHRKRNPAARRKAPAPEVADQITSFDGARFELTYRPARYEEIWLADALGPFLESGLITDVLRLVKGGKEASVYLCAAHPNLGLATGGTGHLAAKVFRPRQFRNLRNDSQYREGRRELGADNKLVRDSRGLRAIAMGSEVGRSMRFESWLAHEFETLRVLQAAECDVPTAVETKGHTILMGYIGDEVRGAPTLSEVRLPPSEAARLFERVVGNIEKMLAAQRVHGDLSAFNVLLWEGEITLIDFPQAVDPYENPSARDLFDRDVLRVCEYFARQGVAAARDARGLADGIWAQHVAPVGTAWRAEGG